MFSKKRKRQESALEYITIFTFLIAQEIEEEAPFTADSKKALIYGLMLAGAIDAICQAFDQDDFIWATGIKCAINKLNFPESFAYYMTLLHQTLDQNDEAYQVILEGGRIAQKWMSSKLNLSSLLFEISPLLEPFIQNEKIPNSVGEIVVKYKLI